MLGGMALVKRDRHKKWNMG